MNENETIKKIRMEWNCIILFIYCAPKKAKLRKDATWCVL